METPRRFLLRLLAFVRRDRAEADLAREIRAHLQLLEDRFLAQGMSADEARFAARRAFGGVEQAKEHHRDARSFRSLDAWWLDVKLGVRMLMKYPGLTFVGGLAMAVAIAIGATAFAFFFASLHPTLPLHEGERIVGLENWDTSRNNQDDRNLHDFVTWRRELKSIQDLAAFTMIQRNLIAPAGSAEGISVAEITASAFRVARVPPLLGRPLLEADERQDGPPVAVIGYDVWRTYFAADPNVVGRQFRLGSASHTVVGVMPEGYAFPINQRVWTPLRLDPADFARRRGPLLTIFGRLAPGVAIDEARAELTIAGQRAAAAYPETHARLQPRIVRYTELWFDDGSRAEMRFVQVLISMLVVLVGVNVAILVYARTATRQGEIAVRTALGASRGRIVGQLFLEALVLSSSAAGAGLLITSVVLRQANAAAKLFAPLVGGLPFWMTFELTPGAVIYAAALAMLAATLAGVVPAVKATGRRTWRLDQVGAGTSMRLGRLWTALIVAQVAFAVAVLPGAVFWASRSIGQAKTEPGFPAHEFIAARLVMDRATPPTANADAYSREFAARYHDRFVELLQRAKAEPGVVGVTSMQREPGDEAETRIEADAAPGSTGPAGVHRVTLNRVAPDFFDVFDVPTVAGRRLDARDGVDSRRIVVNRTFVSDVLGGGTAIGRRVRHVDVDNADPTRPWYEIVGVVGDLPANPVTPEAVQARVYHPMPHGRDYGSKLAVRLRTGDMDRFAGRLREMTLALDPTLRLTSLMPLAESYRRTQMVAHWLALALVIVTLSVLLLSAAGIYALLSFTVTRRRREIGIRVALGADARRILRSVFFRAAIQLGLGVVVGSIAAVLLDIGSEGDLMGGRAALLLPVVSAIMMAVGLLAAFGPARRGLRVNPTEALRAE